MPFISLEINKEKFRNSCAQWDVVKILFLLALPKTGTVELNWSMNLLQIKNSFHLCAHIKIQHKEGKEIAWVVFCRSKWMRHFISTVPDFGRASKKSILTTPHCFIYYLAFLVILLIHQPLVSVDATSMLKFPLQNRTLFTLTFTESPICMLLAYGKRLSLLMESYMYSV